MLLPETFAQDCKARWATLAWCNGARLRAHSNRLSNRAIGESHHHEPEAISLMKDVLDRLDGMGLPDDPLDQLRDTISEMVGSKNPGPDQGSCYQPSQKSYLGVDPAGHREAPFHQDDPERPSSKKSLQVHDDEIRQSPDY